MVNQVVTTTRKVGRPPGAHPSTVFSVRLPGDQAVKLERLAAAMHMTTSAYIQRVMQRHLSNRKHYRRV